MNLPALEQLLAEQACRRVVLETAQAVDGQDYAGFARLFTTDGILVRPDGKRLEGRAAIEQAYAKRDPDRLTRHLITNHLVTFHGPASAASSCNILLWTGRHSDVAGPNGKPADAIELLGEFLDDLIMTPEGWRIRQRQARFSLQRAG
jgi:hypothetical protein